MALVMNLCSVGSVLSAILLFESFLTAHPISFQPKQRKIRQRMTRVMGLSMSSLIKFRIGVRVFSIRSIFVPFFCRYRAAVML